MFPFSTSSALNNWQLEVVGLVTADNILNGAGAHVKSRRQLLVRPPDSVAVALAAVIKVHYPAGYVLKQRLIICLAACLAFTLCHILMMMILTALNSV